MKFVEAIFAFLLRERFFIEMFLASLLFAKNIKTRKYFYIWGTLSLLTFLVVGYFYSSELKNNDVFSIIRYLILAFGVGLTVFLVFEVNVYQALFYTAGAMACQHLSSILYGRIPTPYLQETSLMKGLMFLSQISVYVAVCAVLYFLFIRKIRKYNIRHNILLLFLNILILIVDIIISVLSGPYKNVYFYIMDFLITFVSFFYMFYILMAEDVKAQKLVQEQLAATEKKEFDILKESMERINIKVHDIRHVFNATSDANKKEYLDGLKDSISIYDTYTKTGNTTLDIVLMDKKLHCESKGIQFTIMADATDLSFLEANDIYSFFGNAIENAIEYLSTLSEEKRTMNLNIKRVNQFVLVRIENYFEGTLDLSNGLPQTTKEDKHMHGFGVQSIKKICDKYGAGLTFKKENNTFCLNALFPLQSPSEENAK